MKKLLLTAVCLLSLTGLPAQTLHISGTDSGNSFPIVTPYDKAVVIYDEKDAPVVGTVSKDLCSDIKAVSGAQLSVRNSLSGTADYIIVGGTIGSSEFIDSLIAKHSIDVSDICGKWESYSLQIVSNPFPRVKKALVVCGSTPRGTAYGLFHLSRLMGVSPYIWWADVKPAHQAELYASGNKLTVGEPSVRYRGIFINDEDWGILPWARKGIDAACRSIGPNTYRRIAELIIRLRGNTLWPGTHGSTTAFWTLAGNLKVARDYNLVMSSGNPMLRDNLWEWPRYGGTSKNFNYATNKDMMLRYWAERVGQSRGYDAVYDISCRGFQDEALLGYGSQQEAIAGLTDMISNQRRMLADSIGDPATIPQIYLPYKEALDLYNAGLKIPDDVTLVWPDDNFGHIRQLPTAAEQARSGSNGVYYHLSYLGTPAPYLWLSSMSPSFLSYELTKGYDNGINRFWMFNVGDIKPAEEELQFVMDLAWDIDAWKPQDAWKYSRHWAAETFGEDVADDISDIKLEYYALAAACKPELINRMDFTDSTYNDRVTRYQALEKKVDDVKLRIPTDLQDAFFEMIEYPVKGAAEMNVKIIRAKQSWLYAEAGKRDMALAFAAESSNGYNQILALTDKYNQQVAGGKWNGMMDYKPYGGKVFEKPAAATADAVYPVDGTIDDPLRIYYLAKDYTASSGNVTEIKNMGVAGSSMAVWPLDMRKFTSANYRNAASMSYRVQVRKGVNHIVVRCLPSFPINTSFDLRVGIVMDGKAFAYKSIREKAMSGKWNTTVAEDFADATFEYTSDADKEISLTIYFMDPGLAISDLYIESEKPIANDLTDILLVNADFERNASNAHTASRGIPYGWQMTPTPTSGSHGVNADAANPHNDFCCWVIEYPFPEAFTLSQTIPASKLSPGIYKVSCILWNQNGKSSNCRLFANNSVQYFSSADGAASFLTNGEFNSYASHQGTTTSDATMKPMTVYVTINEGENLQVGIKTSGRKANGTLASGKDPEGWFKVDNFRIRKIAETTGIADIKAPGTIPSRRVYNLLGQKLYDEMPEAGRLPAGIYIIGKKKVIVK